MTLSHRLPWTFSLLICCSAAHGNTPQNMTLGEISRLPPYCVDAQGMGTNQGSPSAPTQQQQRWVATMGDTFWHVHHYCWALLNANRAAHTAMPPQQRKHIYKTAIADSIYVLNQAPRDFVLLPEIYLRMGQFFLAADEPVDALIHFDKSRQAKPDYWPAYLELSKLNVALKRHQDAINVLKSGLAIMPDEPRLTEALASLTAAKPEPTTKRPDRTARTAGK